MYRKIGVSFHETVPLIDTISTAHILEALIGRDNLPPPTRLMVNAGNSIGQNIHSSNAAISGLFP